MLLLSAGFGVLEHGCRGIRACSSIFQGWGVAVGFELQHSRQFIPAPPTWPRCPDRILSGQSFWRSKLKPEAHAKVSAVLIICFYFSTGFYNLTAYILH